MARSNLSYLFSECFSMYTSTMTAPMSPLPCLFLHVSITLRIRRVRLKFKWKQIILVNSIIRAHTHSRKCNKTVCSQIKSGRFTWQFTFEHYFEEEKKEAGSAEHSSSGTKYQKVVFLCSVFIAFERTGKGMKPSTGYSGNSMVAIATGGVSITLHK